MNASAASAIAAACLPGCTADHSIEDADMGRACFAPIGQVSNIERATVSVSGFRLVDEDDTSREAIVAIDVPEARTDGFVFPGTSLWLPMNLAQATSHLEHMARVVAMLSATQAADVVHATAATEPFAVDLSATPCTWCFGPVAVAGPSDDFCSERCQVAWNTDRIGRELPTDETPAETAFLDNVLATAPEFVADMREAEADSAAGIDRSRPLDEVIAELDTEAAGAHPTN